MTNVTPYTTIETHGATLEMPGWLAELWPKDYDLPLEKWPTYCGAGEFWGDWLVPDICCWVNISPACLVHDIDFATLPRTWANFMTANWRLYRNIRALVWAHVDRENWSAIKVERRCLVYLVGTMIGGWGDFTPKPELDWFLNSLVLKKLNRLARTAWGREDWERWR